MSTLDLLLINPAANTMGYQVLAGTLSSIQPPVWAGLMATFVRQKGLPVNIIDAEAEGLAPEEVALRVKEIKPTLVGIVVYGHHPSASTQVMPAVREVARAIRERTPEQKVLILGGHPSALPERTLREEPADFVCDGEGPYTLLDLVNGLKTANMDPSNMRDVWYWENGHPTRSRERAKLITDLDGEMPGIAWDLLPVEKYRAYHCQCLGGLERMPFASLYTSLGCPYACTFCCIQSPFRSGEAALGKTGSSYRLWSPRLIVDQIQMLREEHGVRNFKFEDEIFVLNRQHVEGICNLITERGLKDLNIFALARVDSVMEDMPPLLERAGIRWLGFGIESANAKVRDDVQKGYKQDTIRTTLKRVRAAGIHIVGGFLFGLPEDDLSTMQETLDLAMELNCEHANFYSAMAYPGSALYKMALDLGWTLPDNWSGYAQYSRDTTPLPTKHVSAKEVLHFRDKAFEAYFSNPRFVDHIQRTFGDIAVTEIKEMTKHRLVRNL